MTHFLFKNIVQLFLQESRITLETPQVPLGQSSPVITVSITHYLTQKKNESKWKILKNET